MEVFNFDDMLHGTGKKVIFTENIAYKRMRNITSPSSPSPRDKSPSCTSPFTSPIKQIYEDSSRFKSPIKSLNQTAQNSFLLNVSFFLFCSQNGSY